jgi:hypothetical protein
MFAWANPAHGMLKERLRHLPRTVATGPPHTPPLWSAANQPWVPRVPDIFDEVSEDLRADQARSVLQRYGKLLVGAMLLTLVVVGVVDWWQRQQTANHDEVALKFLAAQKQAAAKPPPADLQQDLAAIAATGPAGYQVLARMQLAATQWDQGQHDKAIAGWDQLAADSSVPPLLRDLATFNSVQHQVDTGNAQALKERLAPLVSGGTRWRPLAEQVTALLDLRLGRTGEAKAIMKSLSEDTQAPPGVRQMAQDILITLGEDGAGPHG